MREKIKKCKVCGDKTKVAFNINFEAISICENCAASIFLQQAKWYVETQREISSTHNSVFIKDDMKKAFGAGARNGSNAGMRVARGGELYMEHFDEWFTKHYNKQ